MIYYNIPYDLDKSLANAYNRFMEMLPNDDDFACFIDRDAMFLMPNYGHLLQDIVDNHPECGAFTAKCNRIGSKWQLANVDWKNDNIKYHIDQANNVFRKYGLNCTDHANSQLGSGFCILLKKSVWAKIGGFSGDGMLGVDNNLHLALRTNGERFYLMEGIYLFHWYRGGNQKNKAHLL